MQFSFDTISNFDKHISDSIRGYELLDSLIVNLCSFFAKDGETIVDLGCSSGRLIHKLANIYPKSKCIGYDITDHNFEKGKAELFKLDVADCDFKIPASNIILSVFTLQFLNYGDRVDVLGKIYESLNKNGIFIICEKEICNTGIIQEAFVFCNFDFKKHNFTAGEILQKELDLRNIMNSLSGGGNESLLRQIGFINIEQFFQSLHFKGWICVK